MAALAAAGAEARAVVLPSPTDLAAAAVVAAVGVAGAPLLPSRCPALAAGALLLAPRASRTSAWRPGSTTCPTRTPTSSRASPWPRSGTRRPSPPVRALGRLSADGHRASTVLARLAGEDWRSPVIVRGSAQTVRGSGDARHRRALRRAAHRRARRGPRGPRLPPLEAHEVRLRTLYSGISAGTELTAYRGSNPYLTKRWNESTRLFEPGERTSFAVPGRRLGLRGGRRGRRGGRGRHARRARATSSTAPGGTAAITSASEDWAAERVLPAGVGPDPGIFSQIGAIALNGVLDADIHVGETVAVFGQGVPGLLCGAARAAQRGRRRRRRRDRTAARAGAEPGRAARRRLPGAGPGRGDQGADRRARRRRRRSRSAALPPP